MMLIATCLFHTIALSLIACKWSDCHWGIQSDADLCLSVAFSFIACKWSDFHLGIQNSADLCLSVLPCSYLIHSL